MLTPLLAERDVADLLSNAEFLWLVGALVATLLVGALVLSWVERWRKRQLSDSPVSEVEQMGMYRQMYERGELSKEEYDRIKAKEAKRLRSKLTAKPAAAPPAAKPTTVQEPPAQPSAQEPNSPAPPA
jgi:hypothetical protein